MQIGLRTTPKGWIECKIGKANDVDRRKKELQTGNPCELILIGKYRFESEDVAFSREAYIHRRFANRATKKGGNEWFVMPMREVVEIDAILSGNGVSWTKKIRLWWVTFWQPKRANFHKLKAMI